jgi:erythromycin esterase-like protein
MNNAGFLIDSATCLAGLEQYQLAMGYLARAKTADLKTGSILQQYKSHQNAGVSKDDKWSQVMVMKKKLDKRLKELESICTAGLRAAQEQQALKKKKQSMAKPVDEYETPGDPDEEESKDIQRDFMAEFRLKPTYFFDGRSQSLEEWIARELPGVKVEIESVPN